MQAVLKCVGHIHTPYLTISECPRNIRFDGPLCELRVAKEYQGEMRGLKEGSHIMVLYWLGRPLDGVGYVPLTDENEPGTFAMRTPYRPNPIGTAVVPIEKIEDNIVYVRGLDCLNETELLDIKPVIFREHWVSKPEVSSLDGCDCDETEGDKVGACRANKPEVASSGGCGCGKPETSASVV